MSNLRLKRFITATMVALLLVTSISTVTSAAVSAAVSSALLSQQLRAREVVGALTGGQFAKIWLGLQPDSSGVDITVTSEWDRFNAVSGGVGFFILDADGLSRVLNGSAQARDANLAAGNTINNAPTNLLEAQFRATGGSYTIVVYNDSASDANFTLQVKNGWITDDSNQVRDPKAPQATSATAITEKTAATQSAAPAATTAPATTVSQSTPTATPAATSEVVTPGQPSVARTQELKGELPNQNDQHFLGLEPSVRDGNITLLLTFDPQDSSELARRLNFWVLDANGFARFSDPKEAVILSNIAIAAGSSDPQLGNNQRKASFTASGFGPYTVIVYNNSRVAGTYNLRVTGGILIDDSGQTLTAKAMAVTATTVTTPTTPSTAAPASQTAPTTSAPAASTVSAGRVGQPGGTYTVKAGDTLGLIARDIYGDVNLWDEICKFNGVTNCDRIEVGDVLKLPTRAEISSGATAPTAAASAPAAPAAAVPTPTPVAAPITETTGLTATTPVTSTNLWTATTPSTAAPTLDIVDMATASGGFETLVQALQAAGLNAALKGAGPFTLFAPTDAAFAALPQGAMAQLLANPTGQLTQILLFHILAGKVMAADITNGMQATTQQGKAVNFEASGDQIKINGANVVVNDMEATNGVIHVIDAVILPPPD